MAQRGRPRKQETTEQTQETAEATETTESIVLSLRSFLDKNLQESEARMKSAIVCGDSGAKRQEIGYKKALKQVVEHIG